MSGSGPKSKDTDSKIKFFKIDREGDIAPAFPNERDRPFEPLGSPLEPMEPVYTMDGERVGAEPEALKMPEMEPQLEQQIHLLRPQVEDISKISDAEVLTTDQADILKKYIALKESEVRDLREQQRQYQAYLKKLTAQLDGNTRKNRELLSDAESVRRHEEALKNENREIREKYQNEIALIKNDYEEKLRASGNYENQVDELMRKREEWREKVKEDLKRIKLKERELENKYELLKRDTQALLDSKDKHVLELKKKNDALELELESLEEKLRKGNTVMGTIDSKKRRLVETLKLAITLLEDIDNPDARMSSDPDRKVG